MWHKLEDRGKDADNDDDDEIYVNLYMTQICRSTGLQSCLRLYHQQKTKVGQ